MVKTDIKIVKNQLEDIVGCENIIYINILEYIQFKTVLLVVAFPYSAW